MHRPLWFATLVATALFSACAPLRPPPPLRTARLEVYGKAGGNVGAYVRAKVAGQPMRLLVDTGATQSMLPIEFARAHKLAKRTGSSEVFLVDAHGERTQLVRLPDVPVQFEGEPAGALEFLMNTSQMSDLAVLAPQDLVRRGWVVVLDLRREELRYEPEQAALTRLRAEGPLQELPFRSCSEEGYFGNSHRAVSVTIGDVPSEMMVDTGASSTVVGRDHPAYPSLSKAKGKERQTVGLASLGRAVDVPDVKIGFAGTSQALPVMVVPDAIPCGGGVLGTDVLGSCTLVWGSSSLWVACRPPGEPALPARL